ncbi:MAG: hypothetical protein MIO88_03970 [Methanoregulaceae archaeon]|nr:hypothetical protein [Methanoregulaceae archaeon]
MTIITYLFPHHFCMRMSRVLISGRTGPCEESVHGKVPGMLSGPGVTFR